MMMLGSGALGHVAAIDSLANRFKHRTFPFRRTLTAVVHHNKAVFLLLN